MEKSKILNRDEIKNFQIKRGIISLYKTFLIILEDLEEEHVNHFNKLYESLLEHETVIKQADYFTEEKLSYLRKKVLDAGNDCIRNIIGDDYEKKQ
jgi:hypothetical protein